MTCSSGSAETGLAVAGTIAGNAEGQLAQVDGKSKRLAIMFGSIARYIVLLPSKVSFFKTKQSNNHAVEKCNIGISWVGLAMGEGQKEVFHTASHVAKAGFK
jgi:hypothetical protein